MFAGRRLGPWRGLLLVSILCGLYLVGLSFGVRLIGFGCLVGCLPLC